MNPWTAISRALGLKEWTSGALTAQAANLRNMLLLIQLRWLAVFGQLATILVAEFGLGVDLPLLWLLAAPAALVFVNLASFPILRRRQGASNPELFLALLVDVAALTWLLALSGGITNPFTPLYLLQVALGAVLLAPAYAWSLIVITSLCTAGLSQVYWPLHLPPSRDGLFFGLYLQGALVCFVLIAVLLVLFVSRISRNLKDRDAYLADLRQQAAEHAHIVRMGLLASGAAHELGTPLSSLAVILSDWRRMPAFRKPELAQDITAMQTAVERCKVIVGGILTSAGEARGESPKRTTLQDFMTDIVSAWRASGAEIEVRQLCHEGADPPIVADPALRQVISALFDNAVEAGAARVVLSTVVDDGRLTITVSDDGPGFAPKILERLGEPYQSTKARPGAGLGLFLLVNVLRTLGGTVEATNPSSGGARIRLIMPLSSLAIPGHIPSGSMLHG